MAADGIVTPRSNSMNHWQGPAIFASLKAIPFLRNLNQWMYTLVELCSWDVAKPKLTDRSNRPWDNPDRRPSHTDRRSTIAREMLRKQFLATLPSMPNLRKFKSLIKDVISLCT